MEVPLLQMMTNSLKKICSIANYGSDYKYHNIYKGVYSRLDEIQTVGVDVKLQHLDSDNQRRRENAKYYRENMSNPKNNFTKSL